MGAIEDLSAFVAAERMRFQLRDNNIFAQSMGQIGQYRRFLALVVGRYQMASEAFVKNTKAMQDAVVDRPQEVGPPHDEAVALMTSLHLEIESFYLFAKILLDKMARSIEYYFGPARGLALDSHDDLVKRFTGYAEAETLTVAPGLVQRAASWKDRVSDYRDYNIAHEKSPRTLRATAFDADGRTRMVLVRLYPTDRDQQIESESPDKLLPDLDAYIQEMLGFLTMNRDRTSLEILEAAAGDAATM